jgi:hypothetical protein
MKNLLWGMVSTLLWWHSHGQPANTNISNGNLFDGEPYIAIHPANPQHLVVAWMSIKFSGGGFRPAISTRASFDGGNTWSAASLLPHAVATYGSADPSLAFDKNGLLYVAYIDYRQSPDSGGIFVARSFNGGLNWDTPTKAFDMYDHPTKRPIDRPWLVVDKSTTANAGTLYITSKPAPWIAPPNRNYFKVSADSGFTWSPMANVDGGTNLVGNSIAQPMAAPATSTNGNFLAAYPSFVSSQNPLPAFYLATSDDKGQTFSYTTMLAAVPTAIDGNLKNGYQLLASPADSNKMIFLVPNASNGDPDIMALHSNDAGQTWSSPVRVNDDAIANGKAQDMVWAAYNEQGKVVVTWRDRRSAAVNGFWDAGYDFYYSTSTDNGSTFSANQLLSSQFIAFDSLISENGNDFMSNVYSGDTLYTTWGDTRTGKLNIYFAKTIVSTNTSVGFTALDGEAPPLLIFPNPAHDRLYVQVSDELIGKEILVMDASGKRVISTLATKNFSWDISPLPTGPYYLTVKNSIVPTQKFIKR